MRLGATDADLRRLVRHTRAMDARTSQTDRWEKHAAVMVGGAFVALLVGAALVTWMVVRASDYEGRLKEPLGERHLVDGACLLEDPARRSACR